MKTPITKRRLRRRWFLINFEPRTNLEINELHHFSTKFYMKQPLECIFCSTLLMVTFDIIQEFSSVT